MPRTVNCQYLKKEAEGLDFAPYPGELGRRIYAGISKEAWQAWMNGSHRSGRRSRSAFSSNARTRAGRISRAA